MKKQNTLIAFTLEDLIKNYGDRWEVRQLARNLKRSGSATESLRLLREFDEINWLELSSPTMISEAEGTPVLAEGGVAQERYFPDVLQLN